VNWKAAALGGGIGLALSLLMGIFSGASLVIMLFRALASGLVTGLVFLGAHWLLKSQFPELLDLETTGPGENEELAPRVDITVDDESDEEEDFIQVAGESSLGTSRPGKVKESSASEARNENGYGDAESVELLEDEGPREQNPRVSPGAPAESPRGGDGDDEEDLPDLSTFASAFQSVPSVDAAPDAYEGGGLSSGPSTIDLNGEAHDPALVARAVQTVLKKDQKG